MPKHEFFVDMTCEGCSNAVTRVLNKLGGVQFEIDLPNKKGYCASGKQRLTWLQSEGGCLHFCQSSFDHSCPARCWRRGEGWEEEEEGLWWGKDYEKFDRRCPTYRPTAVVFLLFGFVIKLGSAIFNSTALSLRLQTKMRVWIFFLFCLAGKALAAPQDALPEEMEVVEDPTIEEPVGINPVQVEVGEFEEPTVDVEEIVAENPCQNYHCKHGKVCELDENNTPMCVCQDPSSCPASTAVFEKVCGTDNKTYDTSCHFFATKCTLEGTKKGHKLHLDYIGPCKFIPECLDTELSEFPLRMRDWLKNVLVTLYERDEDNNLLTEKQKLRVKKIHENEKRLEAGDHTVELLTRDFEKNYNMYIFPVHWQFGQLDQHPVDGYLSHTELAPLRAPLIPMEHCTTRFFETCDLDNDKYIALEEWGSCFGIKEKDIDKDLVI
ncbi:SPARC [Podarcis lilfordi]|uniref:SPARC n=2 Tax=Podarcis TaxID=42163 RepID=A0AA35JWZ5_9SAUR|nr:SPARC [Podarcis lilfordi]